MADVYYLNVLIGAAMVFMSVCRFHMMDEFTRPLIVWVVAAKMGVGLAMAVIPALSPESFQWCAIALGMVVIAEGEVTSHYWWLGVPKQFQFAPHSVHRAPWAGRQQNETHS